MISIDNSSVPFRALLSAILSVVKKVPVEPTEFDPNDPDTKLDTIVEEQGEGPLPEDDINDGSVYSASSGEEIANDPLNTHSRHCTGQRKAESGLMVCPCLLSPVICLAHLLLDYLVVPRFA